MAVVSNADLIEDGDILKVVKVQVEVTVNVSAYNREYDIVSLMRDVKDDIKTTVEGILEQDGMGYPIGIISDVEVA
jgi:hypothetical protein